MTASVALDSGRIAAHLREAADILNAQGANPFRVAAYRKAALTVERHDIDLRDILATTGRNGLADLPGIGAGLAAAIAEMLETGHWAQLDRLRGSLDPATLFRRIPGIGPELAAIARNSLPGVMGGSWNFPWSSAAIKLLAIHLGSLDQVIFA